MVAWEALGKGFLKVVLGSSGGRQGQGRMRGRLLLPPYAIFGLEERVGLVCVYAVAGRLVFGIGVVSL